MERKYSVKLTKSQAELPFFTVLHHTSIPGFNQSQDTDLKKKKITLENKSRIPLIFSLPGDNPQHRLLLTSQLTPREVAAFLPWMETIVHAGTTKNMCLSDTDLYKTCRDTLGLKLLISDHACQRIQGPHQQRNTDKLTKPS